MTLSSQKQSLSADKTAGCALVKRWRRLAPDTAPATTAPEGVTNCSTVLEIGVGLGAGLLNEMVSAAAAGIGAALDRNVRVALWHVWSKEARQVGRVNART